MGNFAKQLVGTPKEIDHVTPITSKERKVPKLVINSLIKSIPNAFDFVFSKAAIAPLIRLRGIRIKFDHGKLLRTATSSNCSACPRYTNCRDASLRKYIQSHRLRPMLHSRTGATSHALWPLTECSRWP